VGHVAALLHGLLHGASLVAGIRAQVLHHAWAGAGCHDLVEGGFQQLGVMPVGPGDDERQRDATPVG
jgi:hypothetical protein